MVPKCVCTCIFAIALCFICVNCLKITYFDFVVLTLSMIILHIDNTFRGLIYIMSFGFVVLTF